jgi:hypothetical protein
LEAVCLLSDQNRRTSSGIGNVDVGVTNSHDLSITPDDETVRPELVEGHLGWLGASTSSARTVFHVNPVTEPPTLASL